MPRTPWIKPMQLERDHCQAEADEPGSGKLRKLLVAQEQKVVTLQAQLAAQEYLEKSLCERLNTLGDQSRQMAAMQTTIGAMQAHLTFTETQLAASQAQIAALTGSDDWKLVQVLRRIRVVAVPPGSIHEKAFFLSRRAWRAGRTEGF